MCLIDTMSENRTCFFISLLGFLGRKKICEPLINNTLGDSAIIILMPTIAWLGYFADTIYQDQHLTSMSVECHILVKKVDGV